MKGPFSKGLFFIAETTVNKAQREEKHRLARYTIPYSLMSLAE